MWVWIQAATWMGSGRRDAGAPDVRRALRVFRLANILQASAVALIALVMTLGS